MEKVAVIYWSQTGNTKEMAEAVVDGAKQAGADASLFPVSGFSEDAVASYDKLALGCPAMGQESLEDTKFEPFFSGLEKKLSGKKVALFGSYGWGDGQWMRDWQNRATQAGANLYQGKGLAVNETPDQNALHICREFGRGFASF